MAHRKVSRFLSFFQTCIDIIHEEADTKEEDEVLKTSLNLISLTPNGKNKEFSFKFWELITDVPKKKITVAQKAHYLKTTKLVQKRSSCLLTKILILNILR